MDYRALSNAVSWERTPIEFEPLSERLIPEFVFPKKKRLQGFWQALRPAAIHHRAFARGVPRHLLKRPR